LQLLLLSGNQFGEIYLFGGVVVLRLTLSLRSTFLELEVLNLVHLERKIGAQGGFLLVLLELQQVAPEEV